jgi:hypothetical protein
LRPGTYLKNAVFLRNRTPENRERLVFLRYRVNVYLSKKQGGEEQAKGERKEAAHG